MSEMLFLVQNVSVARISQALEPEESTADCLVCNRTFLDVSALKKHSSFAHSATPWRLTSDQFKCSDCDRTFGFLVNLKKHRWLKHKRRRVGDLTRAASQQVKLKTTSFFVQKSSTSLLSNSHFKVGRV